MSEVQYYIYTIDEPVACIASRLEDYFAAPDANDTSLAAFLLASFPDGLPSLLIEHAQNAPSMGIGQLNDQLRSAACEDSAWADVSTSAALGNYFEGLAQAKQINTTQLLGLSYFQLTRQPSGETPAALLDAAKRLLNKFEVFGRLFSVYNPLSRKETERFDVPLNYALLSLVLLRLFERNDRPEFLNASLKLNDLIVAIEGQIENPVDAAAACAALCYGKSQVEAFYASREFRLPADQ